MITMPEFPDKQINIEFDEDDRNGAKKSIPSARDEDLSNTYSQIFMN